jgi:hypothetical protein
MSRRLWTLLLFLATLTSALRSGLAAAEGADDPALAAARVRFVGKTVYGYGGVVLGCAPRWVNFYAADAGFVVRDIVRDHGTVSLARGTTAAWAWAASSRFSATNPLRFLVALPRARNFGSNYNQGSPTAPCPALVLTDDQVDSTISTTRPPHLRFGEPPGRWTELHLGQARSEVAWRVGYPTQDEPLSTLRVAAVWHYDRVPFDRFDVAFKHDRVIAVRNHSVRLP